MGQDKKLCNISTLLLKLPKSHNTINSSIVLLWPQGLYAANTLLERVAETFGETCRFFDLRKPPAADIFDMY